jgi:hypothetical protein
MKHLSGAETHVTDIRQASKIWPVISFKNWLLGFLMDKLQLTGQNLGRVFNFRSDHLHSEDLRCYQSKLPNLKLKTRPKQRLGLLP